MPILAPPSASSSSALMRPFVVLALPGMYLVYKYNQYRQQQMETARRRVTERELQQLNTKIDKLLNKLEDYEPELASSQDDEELVDLHLRDDKNCSREVDGMVSADVHLPSSTLACCVICVNAKATMQTSPCGHCVVCRRCFVKTIQMAVSQRQLPLRCVICRAKILRLRHTGHQTSKKLPSSRSWQAPGSSRWGVVESASCYSVGARSVPASASLYSVTSGESSISGVSSVSSASGESPIACGPKLCNGVRCGGPCTGAVPRVPGVAHALVTPGSHASATHAPRQPSSGVLRRSQRHSMKLRLQEYQIRNKAGVCSSEGPEGFKTPSGRLPPIREFQREFREGRRREEPPALGPGPGTVTSPVIPVASASTRIRCAQKIVTQLETTPKKGQNYFRFKNSESSNDITAIAKDLAEAGTSAKKETPKPKKEEKKKKEDPPKKQEDKNKKEENVENKKNELAEKKKEEKIKAKAEKEARKEAKIKAKEEERQAKLLAKEEKKKAKKEAKSALAAEKEKK